MIDLLKEIIEHQVDSGATIVTVGENGPHISNTWNSYIQLKNNTLLIPVAGMNKTESNLKTNDQILLSITNREVQGTMMLGTGILIEGTGRIISEDLQVEQMKEKYPWIRAVLEVEINNIKQLI